MLLAIDQGTTSSRVILFDAKGGVVDVAQKELRLHTPEKGWVEQDPQDIWHDTLWCLKEIAARNDMRDVAACGITNQRETTIVWDRETGEPLYNAIVWQDRRTADYCASLKAQGHEDAIRAKTGLLLDPYFSATKIKWILDHVEGVRDRAESGEILFGTVECFLLWHLSGGKAHVSDASNAARTMLFNIHTQDWDDDLLALFDIPKGILPDVLDNAADFGVIDAQHLGAQIPIAGMAGDQQAALIGQGCFAPGMVKSTYGTGCFALMNIGGTFAESKNRLLTTVGYRLNGAVTYALEGSIFVAGAAIQWLRDNAGFFEDAKESEAIASSVQDNNGVYFVPAFTGLGAPYWEADAKAMICGLSRESHYAHITRAALEAQGYQSRDLIDAMAADAGRGIESIRADGGLVANGFMCQFLADMVDAQIDVPKVHEATAWGAAALAGLQVGVFQDLDEIAAFWQCDVSYKPNMDAGMRGALYAGWKDAVGMLV